MCVCVCVCVYTITNSNQEVRGSLVLILFFKSRIF